MLSDNIINTIDVIRKEKHLSINKLCDGIVSERTYRRYLKSQTSLNTSDLIKIFTRLKIKIVDMIFYLISESNLSLEFKKFLMEFYDENYSCDLATYYQIKGYHNDIEEIDLVVRTYIKKFEFKRQIIDKETYRAFLSENVENIAKKPYKNVYDLSFLTFYFEEFPENEYMDIQTLINDFADDFAHKQRSIMFLIAVNVLLKQAESNHSVTIEKYETIVDLFQVSAYKLKDMNLIDDGNFHKAWICFLLNKKADFEKYLFRFLSGRNLNRNSVEFSTCKARVKTVFGIDLVEFQAYCIKKMLKKQIRT